MPCYFINIDKNNIGFFLISYVDEHVLEYWMKELICALIVEHLNMRILSLILILNGEAQTFKIQSLKLAIADVLCKGQLCALGEITHLMQCLLPEHFYLVACFSGTFSTWNCVCLFICLEVLAGWWRCLFLDHTPAGLAPHPSPTGRFTKTAAYEGSIFERAFVTRTMQCGSLLWADASLSTGKKKRKSAFDIFEKVRQT